MTAKSVTLCAALVAALMSMPAVAQGAGLFATLNGTWNGSGRVKLDSGKTEKSKCKGYYNANGGSELGVAINCANASVRINMRAKLVDSNGKVSGTWEEREFNQSGQVTGSISGDKLKVSFFGGGLTGTLSISATGSTQSVSISTGGPGFIGADLQFSKG